MAIKKRIREALVDNLKDEAIGLGSRFARLVSIRARNWASSAKAAEGTDSAIRIKLTDGNGNVVYLDAADRDYKTAEVVLYPLRDDTATGLDGLAVDATGATITAGAGSPILMESPVTADLVNAGTPTDFFSLTLIVDTDRF